MTIDLNKIYALGLEKFAGDEDKAVEFTKGFQKAAFDYSSLFNVPSQLVPKDQVQSRAGGMLPSILEGAGKGIGGALVTGAVGLIGSGVNSLNNGALHTKFLQALEQAISSSKILKETKRERVLAYAQTIFSFAPHVAGDTNLLISLLNNSVHGDGVDIATVKMLTELEGRYKENSGFSPKSWV